MLQEISSTHRINHRKPKHWFTGSNMDLFNWFENQRPVCFSLATTSFSKGTLLVDFIFSRLIEAPGQLETHSNQAPVLISL